MRNRVTINTAEGDIVIRLYDETPLHRDNFIKLANNGFYNG
ncbi:MAG: peptidylprolyl isomerase, partial [Prevotella sp.]|nr:peptidylprolyl isomerase [Prevotella sp.]